HLTPMPHTPPPPIPPSTPSLHDALPILPARRLPRRARGNPQPATDHRHLLAVADAGGVLLRHLARHARPVHVRARSRHRGRGSQIGRDTSELQSLAYLVCRLLLEKKKTN